MSHRFAWMFGLFLVLAIVGCNKAGTSRCPVTGDVTLDGQPIKEGQVVFIPADGVGSSDACPIVDGKFTGEVAPGSKRVEINASVDSGKTAPDGLPEYISVPPRYNQESTLTAEISQGGQPLKFELTSDGK